ncbi:DUF1343 domain-containing protein [Candidatus Aminicenantes bacterium AC-335-K20]|jgi:uncharacterized protein YbbC (DUF1343 family)|nr:DUF1343 domain-containing protein [SCandidatus Aminicenantes bacterium Aminicenantia_JdfR_composite]MCP2606289.1 DUF1343 domain-containing protein [Candidatus Aminicenantes bacterium AC-708-I09]MCP2619207.1 DUF1343 domain-containing protein [Candidatus Aminicenantes bacterium AC-335-K20]
MKIGLENLLENKIHLLKGKKIGLVANQASVDKNLNLSFHLLYHHPDINLTTIFSPQHGLWGEKQANMIEGEDFQDKKTGLPVFSLYGKRREPTEKMLENVDIVVFDLQDVGIRVYTYISTMALVMQACKKYGKKVVVLDRPNPINGVEVEGNVVESDFISFVGIYPLALRHGMTIGELALMFNHEFKIECDLEVIPMLGWRRKMWFDETEYKWINPSPNIPTLDSAIVYPATVYLEGTNISEGRGTTKPFEFFGAPFIDSEKFADELNRQNLPGVYFRPIAFQPTFDKWKDKLCFGVQIHVLDRDIFKPVHTGLILLKTLYKLFPDDFKWKNPPYEYEYEKLPIDLLWGTDKVRKFIEKDYNINEIEKSWEKDLEDFKNKRNKYLLYD